MNIEYPFKFRELLLTDFVLDTLGFTEYCDGSGDFGDRRLNLGGQIDDEILISKKQFPYYIVMEIDEVSNADNGYEPPEYISKHFSPLNSFADRLYFLHEMYEDVLMNRTPAEIEKFIEITKIPGVNMYVYIKSWIDYKESQL